MLHAKISLQVCAITRTCNTCNVNAADKNHADLRELIATEFRRLKGRKSLAALVDKAARRTDSAATLTKTDLCRIGKADNRVSVDKLMSLNSLLGSSMDTRKLNEYVIELRRTSRPGRSSATAGSPVLDQSFLEEARRSERNKQYLAAYKLLADRWPEFRFDPGTAEIRLEVLEIIRRCLENIKPQERVLLVQEWTTKLVELPEPIEDSKFPDEVMLHEQLEQESRLTIMMRSLFAGLKWPDPYSAWEFVEKLITGPKPSNKNRSVSALEVEPTSDLTASEESLQDFMRAHTHAFYCDPKCGSYLNECRYYFDENVHFRIPSRFAHIVPRVLYRLFSGERTIFDSELARADIAPTNPDSVLRVGRTSFLATMLTHGVAGMVMYNLNGDKVFSGISHFSQGGKFLLQHSQACANSIVVVALVVTSDHHLIIELLNNNNMDGRASWRPAVTGMAIPQDFNQKTSPDNTEPISAPIKAAIRRILVSELLLAPDERKEPDIEITGFALDTLNGKRPFFFGVVLLPKTIQEVKPELEKTNTIFRTYELVPGRYDISLWELLNMDSYRECETLRAAIAFLHDHEVQQINGRHKSGELLPVEHAATR